MKIIGVILIVIGILSAVSEPVGSLFFVACGSILLQLSARKKEKSQGLHPKSPFKRRWQIVVAGCYIVLSFLSNFVTASITSLSLNSNISTVMKVPETQDISFNYTPSTYDAKNIVCESSDESVAKVSVNKIKSGKIIYTITPIKAGEVFINCKADSISVEPIHITISDPAAEEAAKKAEAERKAAEEAAKAEAERKAAEEAAKAEAERKAAEEAAKAEAERKAAEEAAKNEPKGDAAKTVYITKSGKRYHYDSNCNGGTYFESTLEEAKSRGLTPCNKCA